MDITQVPFNKLTGISIADDKAYLLQLDARKEYTNHLNTVHAAALFTLAEGSGAQLLLKAFPEEIVSGVVPVLRKVEVSYKKPAQGIIKSKAFLKDNTFENVLRELQTRKRVSIHTIVELYDEQQVKVFVANFEWFVVLQ